MAETTEHQETESTFQWDENSQLYYHPSTGFYHDPNAGWYYSSRDGLYYKFEDGNYVLLESHQAGDHQPEVHNAVSKGETLEDGEIPIEHSVDPMELNSSNQSEYPPPPSEWLEDTLIDMYLSGYSNQRNSAAAPDMITPTKPNGTDNLSAPGHGYDEIQELEEGEWVPDDPDFWNNLNEKILDEGVSQEEENWRAQYGQVSQSDEEWMSDLHMVDLWDWALVRGTKKDGKTKVARLVGRLRKRSSKLHPAVPAGGGILKTAPVSEVHLDMVRVTSGRIYKLRIPSLQYVASLSAYDASNPTKDWGFPKLSFSKHIENSEQDEQSESQSLEGLGIQKDKFRSQLGSSKKDHIYRDRAAERRALHGGFGVGPGQKSLPGADSSPASPILEPEKAAAESLNISFGQGSYARKLLEGMGWREGDTLGCSMKGLTEPLQAIGNKGTAGLGWELGRRK